MSGYLSNDPVPIYVTRQTAGGYVGSFSLASWQYGLVILVVLMNVLGWGVYGIVELVGKVI